MLSPSVRRANSVSVQTVAVIVMVIAVIAVVAVATVVIAPLVATAHPAKTALHAKIVAIALRVMSSSSSNKLTWHSK
jgi:hypothetical protein